jgi:hypothetical protein
MSRRARRRVARAAVVVAGRRRLGVRRHSLDPLAQAVADRLQVRPDRHFVGNGANSVYVNDDDYPLTAAAAAAADDRRRRRLEVAPGARPSFGSRRSNRRSESTVRRDFPARPAHS